MTQGINITGSITKEFEEILTEPAMRFLTELTTKFQPELAQLLEKRKIFQARMDAGELPDFLEETRSIREGDWSILGIPEDLQDRRVEITGPVDRKMIINALNAKVRVFMADFEDSLSPTWPNVVNGQINLRDANNQDIEFTNEKGKVYKLDENPAMLIARVRGLHLPEKHLTIKIDGTEHFVPGCLFDFAMYFFHNYDTRKNRDSGVYYYVPKIESYLEAAWWSSVFSFTEDHFNAERGTIKATFLIETLPAVFQMDEILHAGKDHIVGLNCGRWDYIFSYIKTLKNHPDRVLPDRQIIGMDTPFLSAYSKLLIKTCHKRGALAMGGMAAFIPAKDAEQNAIVTEKVLSDKTLEASNGHDGTWVAHPGLADIAMDVFNKHIPQGMPNQMDVSRTDDPEFTAADLLAVPEGERTEAGLRTNIRVSIQYIEGWISGTGCVPIYGLMEDAATAEISRASIWQWIHNKKTLSNGKLVTKNLFREILKEELQVVRTEVGEERFADGRYSEAVTMMDKITTGDEMVDFLTLPAYEHL
ncbi:MAG: malate synthase A [Pseudomonadales bacterium]|nr:malate synthase A [Pseudomonadales bacterium]